MHVGGVVWVCENTFTYIYFVLLFCCCCCLEMKSPCVCHASLGLEILNLPRVGLQLYPATPSLISFCIYWYVLIIHINMCDIRSVYFYTCIKHTHWYMSSLPFLSYIYDYYFTFRWTYFTIYIWKRMCGNGLCVSTYHTNFQIKTFFSIDKDSSLKLNNRPFCVRITFSLLIRPFVENWVVFSYEQLGMSLVSVCLSQHKLVSAWCTGFLSFGHWGALNENNPHQLIYLNN